MPIKEIGMETKIPITAIAMGYIVPEMALMVGDRMQANAPAEIKRGKSGQDERAMGIIPKKHIVIMTVALTVATAVITAPPTTPAANAMFSADSLASKSVISMLYS